MWDHNNSDIGHLDYCDGVLDDDGVCAVCEARHAAESAYWKPLYEGEKAAGLHGEFTEEGLAVRKGGRYLSIDDARAMGGYDSSDRDGQGSWSGSPARFSK